MITESSRRREERDPSQKEPVRTDRPMTRPAASKTTQITTARCTASFLLSRRCCSRYSRSCRSRSPCSISLASSALVAPVQWRPHLRQKLPSVSSLQELQTQTNPIVLLLGLPGGPKRYLCPRTNSVLGAPQLGQNSSCFWITCGAARGARSPYRQYPQIKPSPIGTGPRGARSR